MFYALPFADPQCFLYLGNAAWNGLSTLATNGNACCA